MEPRLRLDVAFRDLAFGLAACARKLERSGLEERIEAGFTDEHAAGALVTSSARAALDAALAAVDWPAGSEVLCSALNVPDMARVIAEHGFRCVPVDVDLATLAPRPSAVRARTTERTRALLVAHLFGGRAPVDDLFHDARTRGWLVIEDAAQAWVGLSFRGHPDADLTLFSFGPIKTATALGTGVARVRDPRLLARMRAVAASWPVRSSTSFARRVVKFAALLGATHPVPYAALVRALERRGRLEERLGAWVRGFPPERLFAALRQRPCTAQLALLARRLERFDADRLARRAASGELLGQLLGATVERPGARALARTHWIRPVLVERPDELARLLRRHGYDSTRRATLAALKDARPDATPEAARFERQVLYLPGAGPGGGSSGGAGERSRVERLAELVRAHGGRAAQRA